MSTVGAMQAWDDQRIFRYNLNTEKKTPRREYVKILPWASDDVGNQRMREWGRVHRLGLQILFLETEKTLKIVFLFHGMHNNMEAK